jgi:hypothetical protein
MRIATLRSTRHAVDYPGIRKAHAVPVAGTVMLIAFEVVKYTFLMICTQPRHPWLVVQRRAAVQLKKPAKLSYKIR